MSKPLTPEQIDALTERELDAELARALGWKARRYLEINPYSSGHVGGGWVVTCPTTRPDCRERFTEAPRYSSGFSDAWSIVEALRTRGMQFQLTNPAEVSRYINGELTEPEAVCVVEFHWWLPENGQWLHVHAEAAPDAVPTAICRAALKALQDATS